MKFKFLFLCLFGLLLVSCGDDDSEQEQEQEEVCEDLSALLIGLWDSDENSGTTVEFMTGNQVVDDGFLFVDNDFDAGSTVIKTYTVDGNEKIEFTYSVGFNIRSKTGTVQEFTCNSMRIAVNGAVLNFTKK